MWKRILLFAVLHTVVMEAVRWMAHEIVGTFGVIGSLLSIGAMYGAAVLYESRKKPKILPVLKRQRFGNH